MTGAAPDRPEVTAWADFVESLRTAGEQMATDTAGLDPAEQADGYRALLRGVANQLGRFEIDRERPELVPFNGWRQKFLMDNPDFRYWVADLRADRRYRVRGNRGDAVFVSVTAYARSQGLDAEATARLDSDVISFDAAGNFEVSLGGTTPQKGDWLALSDRTSVLWVRFFHEDVDADRLGECTIEPLDEPGPTAPLEPGRFAAQLGRMGATTQLLPRIFTASASRDQNPPNEIRHWSEMAGGSVFTEPDTHYLRGGWQLEPDEALVLEGELVTCRYWNILAYSRFLNSLDYRSRRVSYTGRTALVIDGRYRFILSGRRPHDAAGDWIDTEGRKFGIVVMRFLAPTRAPELPTVRHVRLDELDSPR